MKKYLIFIMLLLSGLQGYSQEIDSLKLSGFLDGSFRGYGSTYNGYNSNAKDTKFDATFLYGVRVKKNTQHGVGFRFGLRRDIDNSSNGKANIAFGVGLVYQYLYQHHLSKKIAVYGSCTPQIYFSSRVGINTLGIDLQNNIDLGLSYDINKNWTIRANFLSYSSSVYMNIFGSPGSNNNIFYISQDLYSNLLIRGIAIKYLH